MVKQQCLFGTLLSIKVPGRHFLFPESWRKGVKMTEPNRQSGENEERIIEIEIERLRPFKEHPFQVKDDKEMFILQESIEKYHDDMRQVDEIVNLIVETVMCKNDKILIASNWYPASLVKKKFLMLTYSHIEYTWFERLMAE